MKPPLFRHLCAVWLAASLNAAASAQPTPLLQGEQIAPAWVRVGLPENKGIAQPLFEPATVDGQAALRITSSASYGHLLWSPTGAWSEMLQWQWRVDQALSQADLATRAGDDTALRVCALFDLPLSELPFGQSVQLRLARSVSGQALPSATVCYVWDDQQAANARIHNAYSDRVRYWVLRGRGSKPAQWYAERRDLKQDYLTLFGPRAQGAPPLVGISVGADADNTQGHSVAWVRALQAVPNTVGRP
jgi:hypothetical protein